MELVKRKCQSVHKRKFMSKSMFFLSLIVYVLAISPGRLEAQSFVGKTLMVLDERDPVGVVLPNKIPLILIHGVHGNKTDVNGNCGESIDETEDNISHLCKNYWLKFTNYFYLSSLKDTYQLYRYHYVSDEIDVDNISYGLQYFTNLKFGPTRPVVLLAHSMGGLVARSYMTNYGGGTRVKNLITLATPHHGSPFANETGRSCISRQDWEPLMDIGDFGVWNFLEALFPDMPNRSDLRWDNYDNSMNGIWDAQYCYDGNQTEINSWLRSLNNNTVYDAKVIAYYGYIDRYNDDVNTDHNRTWLMNKVNSFFALARVTLLSYACLDIDLLACVQPAGEHQQSLVGNILMSEGMVNNNYWLFNDGLVSADSGRFGGHVVGDRHQFIGYDHLDMKDAKYVNDTFPLFDQVKVDLFDISNPPSVSITLPTNQSTVAGIVSVTTSISDDVKKLEFYVGDTLKFSKNSSPFNWTWDTAGYANGPYSILVKAYDVAGNVGVSAPIGVTVNNSTGNSPPNGPTALGQYKSGGTTVIGIGGSTNERTVGMKGTVSDQNGDSVAIDIEVKKIGIAFQNAPSPACSSVSFVTSGSVAVNTCTGLDDGHYHWQARARDSRGAASAWLPAGGNSESADDFVVAAVVPVNQPPSVSVISPNGGESFVAGSVHSVQWAASDDQGVQTVSIQYSADGGLTSTQVASGLSNSGSNTWTVPGTLTDNGFILVTASDGSLSSTDWSDAPFSIIQTCTLPLAPTLVDPGIYTETGNITINWTAFDVSSFILQEAPDPSFSNFNQYAAAGTSKYLGGKSNGFYYYRIAGINACGQGPFSSVVDIEVRIPAPPGQASSPSPSNGQSNVSRDGITLSWSPGLGTSDVALFFEKNNPDPGIRAGFGGVSGSSFPLLETLDAGTTYYWKIRTRASNGLVTDSPVWSFNTEYTIADLTPIDLTIQGTLGPGNPLALNATIKNIGTFSSGSVRVYLYYSATPGAKDKLLNPNGTDIPPLAPGAEFQISVAATLDQMIAGQSYFVAWVDTHNFPDGNLDNNTYNKSVNYTDGNAPVITWLSLPAYLIYKTGFKYLIGFSAKDDTGITNIDLASSPDGGLTWQDIVIGYVPPGSVQSGSWYEWTIPAGFPLTSNLLVKLTAWDTSGNNSSLTAGPYTVRDGTAPLITIISPNGGEVWDMGSTHNIQWTLTAPNGVFRANILFYYEHADSIADITANSTGSYSWTLPNNFSTKIGKIRIYVEDQNGNESEDWSDGYFEIRDTSSPPPAPWNVPEVVDASVSVVPSTLTSTAVGVDGNGDVHAAYSRYLDEIVNDVRRITSTIFYRKKTAAAWSAPQTVFNRAQDILSTPGYRWGVEGLKIAVDSSNLPHIVWVSGSSGVYENGNEDDIYHAYFDGSSWSQPENLSGSISGTFPVARVAWTSKADLPVAKRPGAYTVYDGKLYLFGGDGFRTNYCFDPAVNSWFQLTDSSGDGVVDGGAAVIGSKIYVLGSPQPTTELKIYDPSSNTWSVGSSLPVYRRYPNVVAFNGKLYAIGGEDVNSTPTGNVYEYIPESDSWSEKQQMPTARVGSVAAEVGGQIYVIGGSTADGSGLNQVEAYDPVTDTWAERTKPIAANWPRPQDSSAAVVDGKIYVIGGREGNAVYEYDPQKNAWFAIMALPSGRTLAGVGAVGTRIYVAGGDDATGAPITSVVEGTVTYELTGTVSGSPDMVRDSSGQINVVWSDGGYWEPAGSDPVLGRLWHGPSSLYHSFRILDGSWVEPFQAASSGNAPSLDSDSFGNVHLAYFADNAFYYRTWDGSAWSIQQVISAGGYAEPDLSVDSSGVPHVAWGDWNEESGTYQIHYTLMDGTWSTPEDASPGGANNIPSRPSLVTDNIGRPHVITENYGFPPSLDYQYRGEIAWSSRMSLLYSSQLPSQYTSSVAISPARDHIHVVTGSNKGLIYNHAIIPTTLDIIAPVVTITAPAVGGVVANNVPYQIEWTVTDDSPIGTVKIEYSADGGNTYVELATAAPNTGSYQWPVPVLEVAAAQLRITAVDPSGNTGMDTSGTFSIKDNQPPQVSLLSPAGGEMWDAGSQHDISWSATDNTGIASVVLFYTTNDGASWASIADGLAAIGTYGWSIPYVYSTTVRVKAVAYDAAGLSSEVASPVLTIVRPNTPPVTPYSPLPPDNQADVALVATIQWSSGDLDGDAVTYTVFFGTDPNPPQVATGAAGTSYMPPPLLEMTVYYWSIVASDGQASAAGPIWKFTTGANPINAPTALSVAVQSATQVDLGWGDNSDNEQGFSVERKIEQSGLYQVIASVGQNVTSFIDTTARGNTTYFYRVRAYNAATYSGYSPEASGTTMNTPPDQPSNPKPVDASSNQVLRATLRWVGVDVDFGDTLTYDVYFGRSVNAPLISEKQQDRQLPIGTLDPNSVYYWRIVAFDSHGDSAAGPWWTFVTGDQSPIISLDPAQLTFSAEKGAGVIGPQALHIVNSGGCVMQWELGTDAGWLTSSSLAGVGDTTVQITVNATGLETGVHQGNLTIMADGADNTPQVVPVTLNITAPVLCIVEPTHLTMSATGELGSISITAVADECSWTAESNNDWMTVTSGASGSGSGTVKFYVSSNSGALRTGTLTVAGTTVTVDQSAPSVRAEFVGIVNSVAYENPYGPAPLAVTFHAGRSTGPNPIVNYHWVFGDGQVADTTAQTVAHSYASTGSYFVTLTVTDSLGGTDSTQRVVSVADVIQLTTASADLQAALSVAGINDKHDIIRLAGGTYLVSGNGASAFAYTTAENKDLILEGGWTPDFSQRAVNITTELRNDVPTPTSGNGGVLRIASGGNVTLDGVTVTGGNTTGNGGGLSVQTPGSIVVGNSRFVGNTAGGDGGGLNLLSTAGILWLYNSTIKGNNAAGGGGGLIMATSAYLYTNDVSGNTASTRDGGLQATVSSAGEMIVTNNTIFGNQATTGSSGLNVAVAGTGGVSLLDIHNNILFGNGTAPGLFVTPDCGAIMGTVDLNIVNNDIDSHEICPDYLLDGSNVGVDFSGRGLGDIRLAATDTALIDKGTDYYVPSEDFEGDAIPLDGDADTNAVPDIGADEYNPVNVAGPASMMVGVSGTITTVGGSATLTVTLDKMAKRDLVVYLSKSDTTLVTLSALYLKILEGQTSAQATVQVQSGAWHGTTTVTATDPSGGIASGSGTVIVNINRAPTLGALNPAVLVSAAGVAQSITAVYSDADGYANFRHTSLRVNTTSGAAYSITVRYEQAKNKLYLYDDGGTGTVGSCAPGTPEMLTNNQGTLNCAATTVAGTGNKLTIAWNITPKVAFAGATAKNIYLWALDNSGAGTVGGWKDKGDWTIKDTNTAPTLGTLTPEVLVSEAGVAQSLSVVYRDADGYANLKQVSLRVNTTSSATNGITVRYERAQNKIYLYDDGGMGTVGSCVPGAASTLTNTQGTLNCAATAVTGVGTNLTVVWNIMPKAVFAGPATKNIYLWDLDNSGAGTGGWKDRGDWTIKDTNMAPALGILAPAVLVSAAGVSQSVSAVYSDTDGYANLKQASLRVNTTSSAADSITVRYEQAQNKLYLYDDGGTGTVGSCVPKAAGTLTNTQGTLNCAATTVTGAGNKLTIAWNITPKAAFSGVMAKNVYLWALDNSGAGTVGWKDKGDWTIKDTNTAPTLGTLTPAVIVSAAGVAQGIIAVYSDADGYANLKHASLRVNKTSSAANSFTVRYERVKNKLHLYNDGGTGIVGSCSPGTAGMLTNTRGTLNCVATTVTGEGNNLTIAWNITPKASFAGVTAKNVYLYVVDNSGVGTAGGWKDKGDWRITP